MITHTLAINTDVFLDATFSYANIIISLMLIIVALKAGIFYGLRLLKQVSCYYEDCRRRYVRHHENI